MKTWLTRLFILGVFAGTITAIYFANVDYQTHLGRLALAQTGLVSLPLDEALVKARSDSKLVLVDVSAIWCPVCRAMDKSVLSDPIVQQELKDKYVYCRLEYESPEGTAFLKDHDAHGFPNLWVLDKNGQVIKHLPLSLTVEKFMGELP